MQPAQRYSSFLATRGVDLATANVVEHSSLAVGEFRFFTVGDPATGEHRAGASTSGVVASGGRPQDAWRELIAAGEPEVVAGRIAWLETQTGSGPHRPGAALALLLPGDELDVPIDPAHWQLVEAPRRSGGGDLPLTLTAWFLPRGQTEPVRWTITAPATGPATIERTPASALVGRAGDAATRARQAAAGGRRQERLWALDELGRGADVGALVPLLRDPEPAIRERAAMALAASGKVTDTAPLRAAYTGEKDVSRRRAMLSAFATMTTAAGTALLSDLADSEPESSLRLEIVHALADRAGADARTALERRARSDADPAVRDLARTYLDRRAR